jgi:hypothetical protein
VAQAVREGGGSRRSSIAAQKGPEAVPEASAGAGGLPGTPRIDGPWGGSIVMTLKFWSPERYSRAEWANPPRPTNPLKNLRKFMNSGIGISPVQLPHIYG